MLRLNLLLREAGIDPARVRLLRHQPVLENGVQLIDAFHSDRKDLQSWQAIQSIKRRPNLAGDYWVTFIGTPDGRTVLEGLYRPVSWQTMLHACVEPLSNALIPAATCDRYLLEPLPQFAEFSGRLLVEWGGGASGKRAWIQRAGNQDKPVTAILERNFEQPFPGYSAFLHSVGGLPRLTDVWISHLRQARGIYLLTCPETGGQYIGSAVGTDGFWGRWQDYLQTGHGGNQGLKDLDARGFDVSILQVAGSGDTVDDILLLEQIWKRKLLSRTFGFNQN